MRVKTIVINPVLIACLLFSTFDIAFAQPHQPLSKHAARVKKQIDGLKTGDHIQVFRIHANEELGIFISEQEDTFTFSATDTTAPVQVKYEDVSQVKVVSHQISVQGSSKRKHLILAAVILGGIFGIAYAAASAK